MPQARHLGPRRHPPGTAPPRPIGPARCLSPDRISRPPFAPPSSSSKTATSASSAATAPAPRTTSSPAATPNTVKPPRQAAQREAHEQLGLHVHTGRLLARAHHAGQDQHDYLAHATGGAFGTGTGEELTDTPDSPGGSHTPTWVPIRDAPLTSARRGRSRPPPNHPDANGSRIITLDVHNANHYGR